MSHRSLELVVRVHQVVEKAAFMGACQTCNTNITDFAETETSMERLKTWQISTIDDKLIKLSTFACSSKRLLTFPFTMLAFLAVQTKPVQMLLVFTMS